MFPNFRNLQGAEPANTGTHSSGMEGTFANGYVPPASAFQRYTAHEQRVKRCARLLVGGVRVEASPPPPDTESDDDATGQRACTEKPEQPEQPKPPEPQEQPEQPEQPAPPAQSDPLADLRRDVAACMTDIIGSMNTRVNHNMQVMQTDHQTLLTALSLILAQHKAEQQASVQAAVLAAEVDIRAALQTEFNSVLRERDVAARDLGMHMETTRAKMQAGLDAHNRHINQLQLELQTKNAEAVLHDAQMQTLLARLTRSEKGIEEVQATNSSNKRKLEQLEQLEQLRAPDFIEWTQQNWTTLVWHASKDEFVWISDIQEALIDKYQKAFPYIQHTLPTLDVASIKRNMRKHFGVLSETIADQYDKKRKPEEGYKAFIMLAPHEPSPWTKKQLRRTGHARL